MTADQLVLEKHARVSSVGAAHRLDTLREMANRLAVNLSTDWAKQRYAALMWAVAELSGISEEIRARNERLNEAKDERIKVKASQLHHFKTVAEQLSAKNKEYKAENHRLRMELDALQNRVMGIEAWVKSGEGV